MSNPLTQAIEFHGQALGLRSERQRLIASNIANADTPGYVARDFSFAQALRDASGGAPMPGSMAASTAASAAGSMATTRAGHISGTRAARSEPELLYATPSQTNLDRNTVDMDRERANFADNAVKYEATLRFINGHVRTMLDAIKGQ